MAFCIGIAYAVTGFSRGLVGESLLVFGDRAPTDAAITTGVVTGAVAGLGCCSAAAVARPALTLPLVVLGVMLPALVLQDTARYSFLKDGRADLALESDLLWAAAQLVLLIGVAAGGEHTPTAVLVTWAGGMVAGAAFAAARLRPRLSIAGVRTWFRVSRELSVWSAAHSVVGQVSMQLTIVFVGLMVGFDVLGGLRAGVAMLGPLVLVMLAVRVVALTEMGGDPHAIAWRTALRGALAASGLATMIATGFAVCLLASRHTVLTALFGAGFARYQDILVPIALAGFAHAVSAGAEVGNRTLAAGRNVFFTQLAANLVGIPLILVLALHGGAPGAAWGLAAQRAVWAVVAWCSFGLLRGRAARSVLAAAEA